MSNKQQENVNSSKSNLAPTNNNNDSDFTAPLIDENYDSLQNQHERLKLQWRNFSMDNVTFQLNHFQSNLFP